MVGQGHALGITAASIPRDSCPGDLGFIHDIRGDAAPRFLLRTLSGPRPRPWHHCRMSFRRLWPEGNCTRIGAILTIL